MMKLIKEALSWVFNNYRLSTDDLSLYEKVNMADYHAASDLHHNTINMIKLG